MTAVGVKRRNLTVKIREDLIEKGRLAGINFSQFLEAKLLEYFEEHKEEISFTMVMRFVRRHSMKNITVEEALKLMVMNGIISEGEYDEYLRILAKRGALKVRL